MLFRSEVHAEKITTDSNRLNKRCKGLMACEIRTELIHVILIGGVTIKTDVPEEMDPTAKMPITACQGACTQRPDVVSELVDDLIANLGGNSPRKRS